MSTNDTKTIEIFDTTFRDGMQQPRMEITISDALKILTMMNAMGVAVAEIGFAFGNAFARQLILAATAGTWSNLKLAVFARTCKPGKSVDDCEDVQEALKLGVPVVVVVCKSRLMDVFESLRTTPEENLRMVRDTVQYLKVRGVEVHLDLEHACDAYFGRGLFGNPAPQYDDFSGDSRVYLKRVVQTALDAGADRIIFCDTNGGTNPFEVAEILQTYVDEYPNVKFGFHGHNDNGFAEANAWAAAHHGAVQVQGTINGYGERTGNTNWLTLVARLQLKDGFRILTPGQLGALSDLAERTALAFGREVPENQPFVGANAFGTSAGMHASSQARNNGAYLQCDPCLVGNHERISINRQSGKANVQLAAERLGVPLTETQVGQLMHEFAAAINNGVFEASETSFVLACRHVRGECPAYFSLVDHHITNGGEGNQRYAKVELKVRVGETVEHVIGEGAGPVDAIRVALRKALQTHYPNLEEFTIAGYNCRALQVAEQGTAAVVLVKVDFTNNLAHAWDIAAASSSQDEAALRALVDSIRWKLFQASATV